MYKDILIYLVHCLILLVSCSSLILFHTLQGSVMPGPVSVVLPAFLLQPHIELFSLQHSLQGDEDRRIYAPDQ